MVSVFGPALCRFCSGFVEGLAVLRGLDTEIADFGQLRVRYETQAHYTNIGSGVFFVVFFWRFFIPPLCQFCGGFEEVLAVLSRDSTRNLVAFIFCGLCSVFRSCFCSVSVSVPVFLGVASVLWRLF